MAGECCCRLELPGWKGTEKWSDEDRSWEWKGGGEMMQNAAQQECPLERPVLALSPGAEMVQGGLDDVHGDVGPQVEKTSWMEYA